MTHTATYQKARRVKRPGAPRPAGCNVYCSCGWRDGAETRGMAKRLFAGHVAAERMSEDHHGPKEGGA